MKNLAELREQYHNRHWQIIRRMKALNNKLYTPKSFTDAEEDEWVDLQDESMDIEEVLYNLGVAFTSLSLHREAWDEEWDEKLNPEHSED